MPVGLTWYIMVPFLKQQALIPWKLKPGMTSWLPVKQFQPLVQLISVSHPVPNMPVIIITILGSILASGGEEFFDAEGNPVFQDSELALKSFDLIAEGIEKGYFDPAGIALDDYETLIEFGAGTTAFMINSTWSATQATQNPELSAVTDSAGIMLIPGWK